MGLNTGTSGQAQLAKSSVYQRDLANLGAAEANAMADLNLQRNNRQAEYEAAMAAAKAENDAALNSALAAEMIRQQQIAYQKERDAVADAQWQKQFDAAQARWEQELAAAQAAAAAKAASTTKTTSGSSGGGYNNGGLSELAIKQYQTELNKLPGVNIAVDGKWGAATTAAANGMSAKEYSDKRSEIIKANASKDTSAYWTR
jgi:hypothetical protein